MASFEFMNKQSPLIEKVISNIKKQNIDIKPVNILHDTITESLDNIKLSNISNSNLSGNISLPENNISLPENNISLPKNNISLPENNISLPENISLDKTINNKNTSIFGSILNIFKKIWNMKWKIIFLLVILFFIYTIYKFKKSLNNNDEDVKNKSTNGIIEDFDDE